MARIVVLGGRTVADLARNLFVVAVMTGVGFAAGFRTPHGTDGLLAALGLVIAFGYAISWGFASLGLRVSDPEAAQAAAVPVMLLLVFTSAAFVPATAMPGWLQAFGTHQPVDALVNAERALILGGPAAHDVLISLAWSVGLLVVFALLAARTPGRPDSSRSRAAPTGISTPTPSTPRYGTASASCAGTSRGTGDAEERFRTVGHRATAAAGGPGPPERGPGRPGPLKTPTRNALPIPAVG